MGTKKSACLALVIAGLAVACSVNDVPAATGDAGKDGGPGVDSSVEGGADAGGDASKVCVFGTSTFGNCVFGP